MNTVFVQTAIVFACVISAGGYVLARYLPRKQIAHWLDTHGYAQTAALLRPARGGGGCHSGNDGGCSTCGSCGSSSPDKSLAAGEQPVRFHPPRR
jgi:hypothetical protein